MRKLTFKYLGLGMIGLLIPSCFLLSHCCSESCNAASKNCSNPKKSNEKMETKCSHCGNTTCDINCSASNKNEKDSTKIISSCSLDSQDQSERLAKIKKEIFDKSIDHKELSNGIEFTFDESKELTLTILEFIEFERGCCKDFTFNLHFEPRNGPIILRISGSSEVIKMFR